MHANFIQLIVHGNNYNVSALAIYTIKRTMSVSVTQLIFRQFYSTIISDKNVPGESLRKIVTENLKSVEILDLCLPNTSDLILCHNKQYDH